MNEYRTQQESGTAAGAAKIIQFGLMAATLLVTPVAATQCSPLAKPPRNYLPLNIGETPNTFGQFANIFSGEYEHARFDFELEVADFYSKLLATQEPLGKEFERVLHDNLSSLYVRT